MNREIKFRAWGGVKMIYDGTEMGISGARVMHDSVWYYHEASDVFFWRECDGEYLYMQYTGLKDKKGTDIYEGDIIKIPDDYEAYGMIAGEVRQVYFLDGSFRLKPKTDGVGRGHTIEDDMDKCEVIGNIYANPELKEIAP